jgi:hypothetical protein
MAALIGFVQGWYWGGDVNRSLGDDPGHPLGVAVWIGMTAVSAAFGWLLVRAIRHVLERRR